MASTLAQLIVPQPVTYFFNLLLGVYQANGFPVQSWQPGGVERTRLMAMATALADKSTNYAPQIAAGVLLDYSTSDGSGGGWLPLLAQEFYNLPQNLATFTQGSITLTAASGVGTQTYTAGKLIAIFASSGNRYLNTGTVVIPSGPGSVIGQFQAEFSGAKYSDPSNSGALTLVTPIPGVTLTNPAGNYSTVTHVGAGTGSLTLGGSPVGPHLVVIQINASGAAGGTAAWSYSIDGGAFVFEGTVASATNIGGTGINVTLVGPSGTDFIINDTYTFTAPGSWITQQGSNIEADSMLQARCRARWSSLSSIPVSNFYFLLATSTPSVGSQVTQCLVVPDPNINSKVNIVVAGPAGVLPGGTISAIDAFIKPRAAQGDFTVVTSPTPLAITIAATITVSASQLTAASSAISTALNNYTASIPINGTLRIAAIIDVIMNVAGVVDVSSVTINGSSSNVTLGGVGSYVLATYPPTQTLNYVTV